LTPVAQAVRVNRPYPCYIASVRYLVKGRVRMGKESALLRAIDQGTLGNGSIAGDEYLCDMEQARLNETGVAQWVETCFCDPPLAEEQPYWEEYFELLSVKFSTCCGQRRAISRLPFVPTVPARVRVSTTSSPVALSDAIRHSSFGLRPWSGLVSLRARVRAGSTQQEVEHLTHLRIMMRQFVP